MSSLAPPAAEMRPTSPTLCTEADETAPNTVPRWSVARPRNTVSSRTRTSTVSLLVAPPAVAAQAAQADAADGDGEGARPAGAAAAPGRSTVVPPRPGRARGATVSALLKSATERSSSKLLQDGVDGGEHPLQGRESRSGSTTSNASSTARKASLGLLTARRRSLSAAAKLSGGNVAPTAPRATRAVQYPVFLDINGNMYDINYAPMAPKSVFPDIQVSDEQGNVSSATVREYGALAVASGLDIALPRSNAASLHSGHTDVAAAAPAGPDTLSTEDALRLAKWLRERSVNDESLGRLALSFPDAADEDAFPTFADYEDAVVAWARDVQHAVGFMCLPQVMGHFYARPLMGAPPDDGDEMETLDEAGRKREPWFAQLYPPEPDPHMYATYDQFENACLNWLAVCSKLDAVPLHARQLAEPFELACQKDPRIISAYRDLRKTHRKRRDTVLARRMGSTGGSVDAHAGSLQAAALAAADAASKSGHRIPGVLDASAEARARVSEADSVSSAASHPALAARRSGRFFALKHGTLSERMHERAGNEWDKFSPETRVVVDRALDGWLGEREAQKAATGAYGPQLLPTIHGVLPNTRHQAEHVHQNTLLASVSTTSTEIASLPLRRTDLDVRQVQASYDSPQVVDGKKVIFSVPAHSLGGVDVKRMGSDSKYRAELTRRLRVAETSARHDQLHSWYYPNLGEDTLKRRYDQACESVRFKSPFSPADLVGLLSSDLFLDQFQDLLGDYVDALEQRTYLTEIMVAFTPQTYRSVLCLFRDTRNGLTHAKLATFVASFFQQAQGKDLYEELIDAQDVEALHWLAHSLTYFATPPRELFQYDADTKALVHEACKPEHVAIVESTLLRYYTAQIVEAIKPDAFLYLPIATFLDEILAAMNGEMIELLEDDRTGFLTDGLWAYLEHRSHIISQQFLFLLAQLMHAKDKTVVKLLRSEETNMLAHARSLAQSSLAHAQYAAERIFALFIADMPWRRWVIQRYGENVKLLVEDLITLPCAVATDYNTVPPLITTLVYEFFRTVLEEAEHPSEIEFLFRQQVARLLVGRLAAVQMPPNEPMALQTVAGLLGHMTFHFHRLGALVAGADGKGGSGKGGAGKRVQMLLPAELTMQVQLHDLQTILNVIFGLPPDATDVKKRLLDVLHNLIKTNNVFDIARSDVGFWKKLQLMCKDEGNFECNRCSWRVFYAIIKYHPHAPAELKRANQLAPFFDLISASSNKTSIVMANGLHYLTKLFMLNMREQDKAYEKAVKVLVKFFFKRALFIKVHMIYKRLSSQSAGIAFQKLAKFYHALMTVPQCQKYVKDLCKNIEYKTGLERLSGIHEERFSWPGEEIELPTTTMDMSQRRKSFRRLG